MVNPDEGRGVASILVGGVAPCVTAPCVGRAELSKLTARLLDGVFAHRWWEEVLYRGFLLRALERLVGRADVATVVSSCVESTSELDFASMAWGARNLISQQVSSLLFAAHHLSLTAALPLAALGATWSYLYLASGNLLVPVAIHALWNARVFAGTVLGL